ncbi:MAG: 4a-hydroxytetrahydrobiopterin dehydratase [Rhodobacteraceae bacterium]|nr:4a-hydroxytetrahydrobiopterin dehydratase [Paracoccaceae bacterium]
MKQLSALEKQRCLDQLRHNGWAYLEERDAITKTYRFPDFTHAMTWMNAVAKLAEQMNHHPEWSNVYNRVTVILTTHSTRSLTTLDVQLANGMDGLYQGGNL